MKNAYNLAEVLAASAKNVADSLLKEGYLEVREAVQEMLSFINDSPYPTHAAYMEEVLRHVCAAREQDQVIL
jgi:hypothetical protein